MDKDFEQALQTYAELLVKTGLNLRAGQRLMIGAPLAAAPLVRLVAANAYQAGARLVDVRWEDEQLTLARYRYAPRDSFEEFPTWQIDALLAHMRGGGALLMIVGDDPDLLKDQDPELIATAKKTEARHAAPALELIGRNAVNWLVASYPTAVWAAKMFPGETPERQERRLWQAIFDVCRLDQPDPIAAWNEHIAHLTSWSSYLNRKQFAALKYRGPGTDLTVGLPRGHIWRSGQITAESGIEFTANMPTEEVFTLPHAQQTSGVVAATRPLNLGGILIDGFSLTFAEGRVVEATATTGEEHLRNLLDTDAGARRIGEVALVPHSSPIAQSGLLFYNTLFDENAASHIALGQAYHFTLEGGERMSEEEFAQAGGNHSMIHIDFMIGSAQLDVDGIHADGTAEPLMRGGEWAFKEET